MLSKTLLFLLTEKLTDFFLSVAWPLMIWLFEIRFLSLGKRSDDASNITLEVLQEFFAKIRSYYSVVLTLKRNLLHLLFTWRGFTITVYLHFVMQVSYQVDFALVHYTKGFLVQEPKTTTAVSCA